MSFIISVNRHSYLVAAKVQKWAGGLSLPHPPPDPSCPPVPETLYPPRTLRLVLAISTPRTPDLFRRRNPLCLFVPVRTTPRSLAGGGRTPRCKRLRQSGSGPRTRGSGEEDTRPPVPRSRGPVGGGEQITTLCFCPAHGWRTPSVALSSVLVHVLFPSALLPRGGSRRPLSLSHPCPSPRVPVLSLRLCPLSLSASLLPSLSLPSFGQCRCSHPYRPRGGRVSPVPGTRGPPSELLGNEAMSRGRMGDPRQDPVLVGGNCTIFTETGPPPGVSCLPFWGSGTRLHPHSRVESRTCLTDTLESRERT